MSNDIHRLVREKNRKLNQWEQYYSKDELQTFPTRIQFPTGTRCNIRCRFCTERGGEKANTDYKDISYKEFCSYIENEGWKEALNSAGMVELYGWGEPLFNPDYEKIFDHLMKNFFDLGISICSNGIMFNRKWAEKIVAVSNSEVNFSVNAATKDTFLRMTGSNQFERVIANIRNLTNLRDKYQTDNPYISLSYVATTENIRELSQFVNLASELKTDRVLVQDVMILDENTERLSLMNEPDLANKMFKLAETRARELKMPFFSFATYQVDYFQKNFEQTENRNDCTQINMFESEEVPSPYFSETDCFEPWEKFMVAEDGNVYPCCRYENHPELSLGNIKKQSFQEIWNGDIYRYIRRTINTDNPPKSCVTCARKVGLF